MTILKSKAWRIIVCFLCLITCAGTACLTGACSSETGDPSIGASVCLNTLTASLDAEEDADAGKVKYIEVSTRNYNGDLTLSVSFFGDEVYWVTEEIQEVENYITAEFEGDKLIKVTCHQAFGTPIKITVALAEYPNIHADCICDYSMRLNGTLYFGDIYFNLTNDYRYGSAIQVTQSIHMDETPFGYGIKFFPPSYTFVDENEYDEYVSALYDTTFSLAPNSEEIEKLGLSNYAFNTVEGTIFELENELGNLFNITWLESLISEDETVDALIEDLKNACYSEPSTDPGYDEITYYVDSVPMYILTVQLPDWDEPAEHQIYFDLYELFEASY